MPRATALPCVELAIMHNSAVMHKLVAVLTSNSKFLSFVVDIRTNSDMTVFLERTLSSCLFQHVLPPRNHPMLDIGPCHQSTTFHECLRSWYDRGALHHRYQFFVYEQFLCSAYISIFRRA